MQGQYSRLWYRLKTQRHLHFPKNLTNLQLSINKVTGLLFLSSDTFLSLRFVAEEWRKHWHVTPSYSI